jgi:hypothetical protein
MQGGTPLRNRYGLYYGVLSPVFAHPREETTPARLGGHGMGGKDGILFAVEVALKRVPRVIKILNGTWQHSN